MLTRAFVKKSFGTLLEYTKSNRNKRKLKSSRVSKTQNIIIMKKITFLVASILLMGAGVANATTTNNLSHERRMPINFRGAEPIVFTERGVEFFVFADGQFDFNTRPSSGSKMYYKPNGRRNVNGTYGAPMNTRNQNFGVTVEHDEFGRVRRVGNVFVNYDVNGRIKRVGSVYMTYNRFALEQVGGLQIIYNRRGQIVDIIGSVNGRTANEPIQINRYDNDYEYGNSRGRDEVPSRYEDSSNDQDQYYFKKNDTKVKADEAKITGSVDVRINRR